MKEHDPTKFAFKASERKLIELFGPNVTPEVEEIMKRAGDEVCKYFAYVHAFVPTIEQPYPLSDDEFFKQKDKDA